MSQTHPPRRIARSIGAVFVGLLAIVITSTATDLVLHVTGVFPPPGHPMSAALWLLATAYRIAFGVAGCYVAARLAPDRPMRHAVALGLVGVAAGIVGAVVTWGKGPALGPAWYSIAILAIPLPCAWAGGKLREMRLVATPTDR